MFIVAFFLEYILFFILLILLVIYLLAELRQIIIKKSFYLPSILLGLILNFVLFDLLTDPIIGVRSSLLGFLVGLGVGLILLFLYVNIVQLTTIVAQTTYRFILHILYNKNINKYWEQYISVLESLNIFPFIFLKLVPTLANIITIGPTKNGNVKYMLVSKVASTLCLTKLTSIINIT